MKKKSVSAVSILIAVLLSALLATGCSEKPSDTGSGTDSAERTQASESVADTAAASAEETADDSGASTAQDTEAPLAEPGASAVVSEGDKVTVRLEGGRDIVLGAAADDVIPALGECKDKLEAPSCVHPGNDVVYYYDGFAVTTSPDAAGKNVVVGIEITSGAVRLANSVTVGSDVSAAKAAFGDGFTEAFGMITYELGAGSIQIVSDGSKVTAISITVTV